jgi:hypothetical protein
MDTMTENVCDHLSSKYTLSQEQSAQTVLYIGVEVTMAITFALR